MTCRSSWSARADELRYIHLFRVFRLYLRGQFAARNARDQHALGRCPHLGDGLARELEASTRSCAAWPRRASTAGRASSRQRMLWVVASKSWMRVKFARRSRTGQTTGSSTSSTALCATRSHRWSGSLRQPRLPRRPCPSARRRPFGPRIAARLSWTACKPESARAVELHRHCSRWVGATACAQIRGGVAAVQCGA